MANLTYSVVARSCARLMIGKVYWNSIVLPMILYGANLIDFTKQEIQQLQRIENSSGGQSVSTDGRFVSPSLTDSRFAGGLTTDGN